MSSVVTLLPPLSCRAMICRRIDSAVELGQDMSGRSWWDFLFAFNVSKFLALPLLDVLSCVGGDIVVVVSRGAPDHALDEHFQRSSSVSPVCPKKSNQPSCQVRVSWSVSKVAMRLPCRIMVAGLQHTVRPGSRVLS